MNCTGDIEFCVMCENPDTKLESDDFDFCKKCKLKEVTSWYNKYKKISDYLIKQIPESNREQVVRAAFSRIK